MGDIIIFVCRERMGYNVEYKVEIVIKKCSLDDALCAINRLHTMDVMKEKIKYTSYFDGSDIKEPADIKTWAQIKKYLWYAWVQNPEKEGGWKTLQEAFETWSIIDTGLSTTKRIPKPLALPDGDTRENKNTEYFVKHTKQMYSYNENGDFVIKGLYQSKLGDQRILLEAISPFCENFRITVVGEDDKVFTWKNKKGVFTETETETED